MRAITILLLLFGFSKCGVVDPALVSGAAGEGFSPDVFMNAATAILHEQGYTVVTADRVAGVVTTDWRDESSFFGQTFLQESHRTRVSVVVDFYTLQITVQMTKQVREHNKPWRNENLSGKDRRRMQTILSQIQERARVLHERGNLVY